MLNRRNFNRLLATAAALCLSGPTLAADYPQEAVTIIVPYSAGGPGDTVTRTIAEKLETKIGQPVVIENAGGAGGNIGAARAASAKPDGLTLLSMSESILTVNPSVYANMPFDPADAFVPIAPLGYNSYMLGMNPKSEVTSLKELIDASHKEPLKFSSGGNGSPGHLAMAYLSTVADFDWVNVAYKGGSPAAKALVAGEVDGGFLSVAVTKSYTDAGQVIPILSSSSERLELLPDVPTGQEAGFDDFVIELYFGLFAPKGTSEEIVNILNKATQDVLADPEVIEKMAALGVIVSGGAPDKLGKIVTENAKKWGDVMKASGVIPQ